MRTPKEIKADIQKLTEELKASQQAHTLKVGEAAMRKLNELGFKYSDKDGWIKPQAETPHCFRAGDLAIDMRGTVYYIRSASWSGGEQRLTVSRVNGMTLRGGQVHELKVAMMSSKVKPISREDAIKVTSADGYKRY